MLEIVNNKTSPTFEEQVDSAKNKAPGAYFCAKRNIKVISNESF